MGWAGGSTIATSMIEACVAEIPRRETRKNLYRAIYDALLSEDWDTVDEAMGIDDAFDEVVAEEDEE